MLKQRTQQKFEIWTNNTDLIGDFYPHNTNFKDAKLKNSNTVCVNSLKYRLKKAIFHTFLYILSMAICTENINNYKRLTFYLKTWVLRKISKKNGLFTFGGRDSGVFLII